MGKKLAVSSFARGRHTPESNMSHYDGSWDELVARTVANFDKAKPGYRDGVVLVPVPPAGFYSGVAEITEDMKFETRATRRREGEDLYKETNVVGEKPTAVVCDIVCYRHDVLGDEAETDAEWEVVSVNAAADFEEQPQDPISMARNMKQRPGGTAAQYTAEQFMESILYWERHCHIKPPQ